MSTSVTIPIAGFKDVYDVPTVEKALQDLPPGANEALRAVYEKMLRLGGQRFTVKPSALPQMEPLFDELPNFAVVLADIRKHLEPKISKIEMPAEIEFRDALPKTMIGKLSKKELKAEEDQRRKAKGK